MRSCGYGFFRTNVIISIVLENCGRKTGQTVPRPVKWFPKAEKRDMHGKTFVAAGVSFCMKPWKKVVGRGRG